MTISDEGTVTTKKRIHAQKDETARSVEVGVSTFIGLGITPQSSAGVGVHSIYQSQIGDFQGEFSLIPNQRYQNQGGIGASLEVLNFQLQFCKHLERGVSRLGTCLGSFLTRLNGDGYQIAGSEETSDVSFGPQLEIHFSQKWPKGFFWNFRLTGRGALGIQDFEVVGQSDVRFSPSKLSFLLGFGIGYFIF